MKDWDNLECHKCNSVNDYNVTEKNGQSVCRCNKCNTYLGSKPKTGDVLSVIMPFGKYKGILVQDIDDKGYLEWVMDNVKISNTLGQSIQLRLDWEHFDGV